MVARLQIKDLPLDMQQQILADMHQQILPEAEKPKNKVIRRTEADGWWTRFCQMVKRDLLGFFRVILMSSLTFHAFGIGLYLWKHIVWGKVAGINLAVTLATGMIVWALRRRQ